jgi:GT2 family glycosyltransferase
LIHEDTDLNFRAHLYGWKVLYAPEAIVYHKVRSTIGKMSDTAVYYSLRNSEFVRIKNIPFGVIQRCLAELCIATLLEILYFGLKYKKLNLYFRAKVDALKMLPKMLQKRKLIMKNRKADNRDLLNLMTPVWEKDFLKSKIDKFLYG